MGIKKSPAYVVRAFDWCPARMNNSSGLRCKGKAFFLNNKKKNAKGC